MFRDEDDTFLRKATPLLFKENEIINIDEIVEQLANQTQINDSLDLLIKHRNKERLKYIPRGIGLSLSLLTLGSLSYFLVRFLKKNPVVLDFAAYNNTFLAAFNSTCGERYPLQNVCDAYALFNTTQNQASFCGTVAQALCSAKPLLDLFTNAIITGTNYTCMQAYPTKDFQKWYKIGGAAYDCYEVAQEYCGGLLSYTESWVLDVYNQYTSDIGPPFYRCGEVLPLTDLCDHAYAKTAAYYCANIARQLVDYSFQMNTDYNTMWNTVNCNETYPDYYELGSRYQCYTQGTSICNSYNTHVDNSHFNDSGWWDRRKIYILVGVSIGALLLLGLGIFLIIQTSRLHPKNKVTELTEEEQSQINDAARKAHLDHPTDISIAKAIETFKETQEDIKTKKLQMTEIRQAFVGEGLEGRPDSPLHTFLMRDTNRDLTLHIFSFAGLWRKAPEKKEEVKTTLRLT